MIMALSSTPKVLTVKYFGAADLFLFEQTWPDGLALEYTSRAGLAAAFPNCPRPPGALKRP
jgi:hypothetical protein